MGPADSDPSRQTARWWPEALVTAAAAVVVSLVVFQIWRQPLSVPFNYDGDGPYYLMLAQGLKQHGSFLVNPNLGFPVGQVLYDTPENLDFLHIVVLRVLSGFASAATAANLFQLLTFPTIAATAHVVLRRFGIHRLLAAAFALLFAFLPYHLQRRNSHLFLSSYALVPVLVLLAVALVSASPPSVDPRRLRNWWTLAACLGLAMSGPYYAAFAVLLWSVAATYGAWLHRSWNRLWTGATMVAIIGAVTVAEMLPNLRYWREHGRNAAVIARSPQETEQYGIRLQQLFMPRWDHRVPFMSQLGAKSLKGPYLAEGTQSLGVIGAIGFLGILGFVLLRTLRGTAARQDEHSPVGPLAFVSVAALLIGINGGFGFFVSWAGLRPIRAYNRLTVVIAFCVFAVVAIVLTRWIERQRSPRRVLVPVLAAAVLLFGLVDQTSPRDSVVVASGRATWEMDQRFYGAMAAALPADSGVVQLPYVTFPENTGVGQIGTYDPGRAYLHAPELRWSFGAVEGRAPHPPDDLFTRDGAAIVDYVRSTGARAFVIDAYGFVDLGTDLNRRLTEAGWTPNGLSENGRYAWYDIGASGGG